MAGSRSRQAALARRPRWRATLLGLGWWVLLAASVISAWWSLVGLGFFEETPLAAPPAFDAIKRGLPIGGLLVVLLLSTAAALVAVYGLLRGIRGRGDGRQHVLVADDQGFVLVDSQGVEAVACAAALRAPGVVEADVEARGSGANPIRLWAEVGVHPGAALDEAGRAARRLVKSAVEQLVGLSVADVVVRVHVLDAEELGRALR